jgi:NDP-sugar pyrophosphorylase family protein
MIADGRRLYALPLEGFWSDVGTPEDLVRAEQLLRELTPTRSS